MDCVLACHQYCQVKNVGIRITHMQQRLSRLIYIKHRSHILLKQLLNGRDIAIFDMLEDRSVAWSDIVDIKTEIPPRMSP